MEIKVIKVGELLTNCYIITKDSNTLIIDPGAEKDKIINYLENNNLNLKAILITHSHFDHVGALNDLLNYKKVEVYKNSNIEEKNYNIYGFNIDIIKTYGHTNDSISFYLKDDNIMFVGDFIFKGSIGRTDLGGNINDMKDSITKIKSYSDNIIIYPGHGPSTILIEEKKHNPYFNM